MHLLVLSAFRRAKPSTSSGRRLRSQCTFWCSVLSDRKHAGISHLSIESQCTFWCSVLSDGRGPRGWDPSKVSMHLLVLSAFRLELSVGADRTTQRLNAPFGAQCFPTLGGPLEEVQGRQSQCTFWCSVLSDSASRKPRRNAVSRDENAADLESTKSNRLAPLQLNHTTAENRHKSTQRRQHPLPIGTPPAFNEPTPKDRSLATPPR